MNSQRQSDKKKKSGSAVFTKETFGVVTVLFATLCVICLITKDAIFYAPGKHVCDFLMGVFGYFAYPVGFYAAIKGVMLIVNKKSGIPFKRKFLIFLSFVFAAFFAQIVSMGAGYATFNEYLSASYSLGENVYSAGGVVAALGAYFLQALLTVVGSAVITGLLFTLCVYFTIADIVKGNRSVSSEREFRSSYVKNEQNTTAETTVNDQSQTIGETNAPVSAMPKSGQKLFVNNADDFAFKSRREMQKDNSPSLKVAANDNALNVSGYTGSSYSSGFTSDLQKKIEYVKTPSPINIDNDASKRNAAGPSVSDYISVRKEETESKADTEKDIPMIEHETSFGDAKSRAAAFGDRYARSEFTPPQRDTVDLTRHENDKASEERIAPEPRDLGVIDESAARTGDAVNSTEDDVHEVIYEAPPAPRIREGRARRILFDDESDKNTIEEKPAFTSRVVPDDNVRSAFTPERESVDEDTFTEEKPQKPPVPINRPYFKPPLDLLETYAPPADAPQEDHEGRMRTIVQLLDEFHIPVEPVGYIQGPTITRYEVRMSAGIPVRKVTTYDNDLKMRLESKSGIIIQAPIPGKNGVGIEVANKYKVTVGLKDVLQGATDLKTGPDSLIFALGKDIVGNSKMDDLSKGPHYLIAGSTGSGKSVCLNVMIVSLIMRYTPEELRFILIDPKRVEFRKYEHLPHLMIDEIVTEPQKAVAVLEWAIQEMERRYVEFAKVEGGIVGNIDAYNRIVASDTVPKMPKIVIVVDELADLMEYCKKDMETGIRRLAAKARAAGIHLVLATQRPSVDVITGTIKGNLPCRIALKVTSTPDSMTILNEGGAEKLLGKGDMLYKGAEASDPVRYQGAWISDMEIANVVSYIKEKNAAYYDDDLKDYLDKAMRAGQEETAAGASDEEDNDGIDDFFLKALWLAVTSNSVSISQLQRRFQIGYARAGGLVDKMERLGFVSANEGSKARRVLITREEYEERFGEPPASK